MEPLLLLHGALGAPIQLFNLAGQFSDEYKVYSLAFTGHGGKEIPNEPLSIVLFAGEVLQFMEDNGINKISIFGYSMGGYVAMYLAKNYPEKIKRVITLATKYAWNEAIAAKEMKMLNPEKTEEKSPPFAVALHKLHAPEDWKKLMVKTAEMMEDMGKDNPLKPADFSGIQAPVLLLLGDRDKMVTLEETLSVFKALPNAQMGMLPNTQHPVDRADVELLGYMVKKFLK
jgi:pimeloyl-ACP methyl ester carboxylesterase